MFTVGLSIIKTIFFLFLSVAAVTFWVNGATGWREKGEFKKLYAVSFVVLIVAAGFLYLLPKLR
ncbi:hypothetical protein [Phosphitispora fastidiosa]|uniref:hypothetical protein n=1 Tax=Phosphitispora fastidiosa TaxID=2837202 RepID=UPI001E4D4915|nr:hypothetical protein [Phosphitispora fastidiosa]MBU7008896.1 hypothetical protein [Phosphitispora fastidiosa]